MSVHPVVQNAMGSQPQGNGCETFRALVQLFGAGFRRWARRKAIVQLQSLDDHQLLDIGILRSEIPVVVDRLFSEEGDSDPKEDRKEAA